jgi:hypothetical protein
MLLGERGFLGSLSRRIRIWRPVLHVSREEWIAQDDEHFDCLVGAGDLDAQKQWLLKTLDDRLSILDAKFAGILQLDAVFTAVTVFLLREVAADSQNWVRITGTIFFVVSIFFLFVSIWKTRPRLFTQFAHLSAAAPDIRRYQRQLSGLTYERLCLMDESHFAALWGGIFIVLFALLVSGQKLGICGEKPSPQPVYIVSPPKPEATSQGDTGNPVAAPATQPPGDTRASPARKQ